MHSIFQLLVSDTELMGVIANVQGIVIVNRSLHWKMLPGIHTLVYTSAVANENRRLSLHQ